jgi:acetyl/propionyl-CoA carboxylase alpha subunit
VAAPIRTLLVANRGEIARRILRTARAMGIRTVAVYAEPDAGSPHVVDADLAVPLGGSTPAESYLDIPRLLDAAARSGADAVHPGYGFLSENADFATAVIEAGLTWVGPQPGHIEQMGSKLESKELAGRVGVPTLPSVRVEPGGDLDPVLTDVGFPLLVKASAGGGGRGMRLVRAVDELADAVVAAAREAESSFGDGTVFCERYVAVGRHVEVQVFGDANGTVVHLGERECSIQRRNQKVIEEAPSPGIGDGLRGRMQAAAVQLASAIGYVGAGTVEFLVDGSGDDALFWFLEMNTRLQVEHTVTEETFGVDLVRWQLLVAQGEPIPLAQDQLAPRGSAIEARLYAEDPDQDWMPTFGRLHRYRADPRTTGIRWEDGFADGCLVSTFYDAMLAKVVSWAPTRSEAAAALARALEGLAVHGPTTNRNTLVAVLRTPAFLAGATHTSFFDDHPEVFRAGPDPAVRRVHLVATVLAEQQHRRAEDRVWGFAPSGWRNLPTQGQRTAYRSPDGEIHAVEYAAGSGGRWSLDLAGRPTEARLLSCRHDGDETEVLLDVDGTTTAVLLHWAAGTIYANSAGGQTELVEVERFPLPNPADTAGGPTAPVPGTVIAVHVAPGDQVAEGAVLVVLEAMKMEHRIPAAGPATIADVRVAVGDRVTDGQLLVTFAHPGSSDPGTAGP